MYLFHFSLMPILDNEDYANLTPVALFFGMDNAEELTELGINYSIFFFFQHF